MNSNGELYLDFEWPVAVAHDWKAWLDENGRAVVVPNEGLVSLETPAAVELAVKQAAKGGRETGPVLCDRPGDYKRYKPMQREHAALFRTFASLDYHDRDAIRGFANDYGLLGIRQQEQHVLADGDRAEHTAIGESHLQWAYEICLMKEGVRFEHRLSEHETIAPRQHERFAWLFNRQLQYVQHRTTFNHNQPRFPIAPLTLLAAMWLQLSRAITGGKQFIECKSCRRLLELSTEESGFRRHREFCSDVCKTNDYRRRKRTALKLASQGKSLAEIAELTETRRSTVRGWLTDVKRGRPGAPHARPGEPRRRSRST